jgi:hypothetical protein
LVSLPTQPPPKIQVEESRSKMLLRLHSVLTFFAVIGVCVCIDCSRNPEKEKDEYDLRFLLFCKNQYDPHVRPVLDRQDRILVNVSLDLKYVELVRTNILYHYYFPMTSVIF